MKLRHTPGPWDVRKIESAVGFRGVFGICSAPSGNGIREEERANHALIRFAPEMHELLTKLLEADRPTDPYHRAMIERLLAKVEAK